MRKRFHGKVILPIMFMTLSLTACGVLPAGGAENAGSAPGSVAKLSIPEQLSEEEQEQLIRTAIENTLPEGEGIRKLCFTDYDHNGRPEAFVLTGKELEEAKGRYEAWLNGEEEADGEEEPDEEAGFESGEELDSEEDPDEEADIDGEEESDADDEIDEDEFDLMMKQYDYDSQLTMWFAYVEDGEVVSEKVLEGATRDSDILTLKSASLFQCVGYCATSFPADLYQVEGNQYKVIFHGNTMDGHALDYDKSGKALNETISGESDDFVSVASTYDSSYDYDLEMGTGHTWKPYYFHYENGVVTEYKGQEMSRQEFLQEYSNAEQMLKKYQKKDEFLSAIKRENGMVHVNFVARNDTYEGHSYVTFRVLDGELTEPYEDAGTYHTTIEEEDYTQIKYMDEED